MISVDRKNEADLVEYHKGELCPYSSKVLLCQEGFCSECAIKREYDRAQVNKEEREY